LDGKKTKRDPKTTRNNLRVAKLQPWQWPSTHRRVMFKLLITQNKAKERKIAMKY
jgi:hypothetical protein